MGRWADNCWIGLCSFFPGVGGIYKRFLFQYGSLDLCLWVLHNHKDYALCSKRGRCPRISNQPWRKNLHNNFILKHPCTFTWRHFPFWGKWSSVEWKHKHSSQLWPLVNNIKVSNFHSPHCFWNLPRVCTLQNTPVLVEKRRQNKHQYLDPPHPLLPIFSIFSQQCNPVSCHNTLLFWNGLRSWFILVDLHGLRASVVHNLTVPLQDLL